MQFHRKDRRREFAALKDSGYFTSVAFRTGPEKIAAVAFSNLFNLFGRAIRER